MACVYLLGILATVVQLVSCAPNSYPHIYPGVPDVDYSPEWQTYFQVDNSLPALGFELGDSYAGNIPVQRPGHPNDTLFFWGFEKENGSLIAAAGERSKEPWAVWLQGGPGTSSMVGLFTENGPITLNPGTKTFSNNNYSWSNLIDYFWVDQPVGVGFSTADSQGYVNDEDQVGADFVGFLDNLVKVFPSLATRPLYITGESYAGRYIPYIVKTLFSMPDPPVVLAKMVIGDPALGSKHEFKTLPTLSLIETYPQLVGYDTNVYDYFKQQAHLCGLDINLTYPQQGTFPTIELVAGGGSRTNSPDQDDANIPKSKRAGSSRSFESEVVARLYARLSHEDLYDGQGKQKEKSNRKRSLSASANPTIDPWYGCYLWDELVDYAVNFTYLWNASQSYDNFDVPDALNPEPSNDPGFFLNLNEVRTALHAPTSKDWSHSIDYPWGSKNTGGDPSPESMVFLTELATNATNNGVQFIFYVGNDDGISPHFGTEVTIQNTTFGGVQGFTQRPSTPWFSDDGNWAGIVHQERNWTYALFYGTGHEVAQGKPVAAYTFLREFVLENNQTGLVQTTNGQLTVMGGQNPTLQQTAIPGQAGIAYGSITTEGLYTYPSATVVAWQSHVGYTPITDTGEVEASTTSAPNSSPKPSAAIRRGLLKGSRRYLLTVTSIFLLVGSVTVF